MLGKLIVGALCLTTGLLITRLFDEFEINRLKEQLTEFREKNTKLARENSALVKENCRLRSKLDPINLPDFHTW